MKNKSLQLSLDAVPLVVSPPDWADGVPRPGDPHGPGPGPGLSVWVILQDVTSLRRVPLIHSFEGSPCHEDCIVKSGSSKCPESHWERPNLPPLSLLEDLSCGQVNHLIITIFIQLHHTSSH